MHIFWKFDFYINEKCAWFSSRHFNFLPCDVCLPFKTLHFMMNPVDANSQKVLSCILQMTHEN